MNPNGFLKIFSNVVYNTSAIQRIGIYESKKKGRYAHIVFKSSGYDGFAGNAFFLYGGTTSDERIIYEDKDPVPFRNVEQFIDSHKFVEEITSNKQ